MDSAQKYIQIFFKARLAIAMVFILSITQGCATGAGQRYSSTDKLIFMQGLNSMFTPAKYQYTTPQATRVPAQNDSDVYLRALKRQQLLNSIQGY